MMIETDRLVLRPITMADLDDEARMMGDPQVMQYITGGVPRARERVQQSIERATTYFTARALGIFSVRTHDGAFVGDGLLVPIRASGVSVDDHGLTDDSEIEVGYRLSPAQWSKGYATEIARALVAYAMDDDTGPRLDRIIGVTDPANGASKRVLEKAGLVYVGETDAYYDTTVSLYERTR